ncbi:MAG: isoprenyl transferase [Firmicutes bacterium]|nr:isoprenyl transferase [Bacillota bacterium]
MRGGQAVQERHNVKQQFNSQLPTHLGIIMDGNGRWAKERNLPRIAGHREGMKRAKETVEAVARRGIAFLSLYVFSTENWKRPKSEVNFLMSLLRDSIYSEFDSLKNNNVRLVCSGRLAELPDNLADELNALVAATKDNTGLTLNLAINYGGRAEIIDATKKICQDVLAGKVEISQITEDLYARYLYQPELPPVDLIIRPSGEMRLSNFLLWQGAYAELVTLPTLWPDFSEADLDAALLEYGSRDRRFGGITE